MAEDKNKIKKGFGALKKNRETTELSKKVKTPVQKVSKEIVKPIVRQGRPSAKDPGVKYVRIGALVPEDIRDKMKISLLTRCKGLHDTQEEFISSALIHYIKHLEMR